MRITALLCCLGLLVSSSYGAIQIKVAVGSQIESATGIGACASDTSACCSNWGASQYRYSGMKCLRDGGMQSYTGCVPNIDFPKGNPPFSCGITDQVDGQYLVYGKADKFIVPATGTYSLYMRYNVYAFFIIDGKHVNAKLDRDTSATARILALNPFEVIGTVESGTESSSIKNIKTTLDLTEGEHTFEFYYSRYDHESACMLLWKKPGDADYSTIPSSAFGEQTCDRCLTSVRQSVAARSGAQNIIALNGNTLTFSGKTAGAVEVFNIRGSKVARASDCSSMDLGSLKNGSYVVKVTGSGFSAQGQVKIVR